MGITLLCMTEMLLPTEAVAEGVWTHEIGDEKQEWPSVDDECDEENWKIGGNRTKYFHCERYFLQEQKTCELTNCELTGRSRVPIDCRREKIKLLLACSCPRLLFSFCKNYNRGSTGTYLSDGEFWCLPTVGG